MTTTTHYQPVVLFGAIALALLHELVQFSFRRSEHPVIPAKYFENSEVQFDDHRILALARYSGVRILFTSDRDLIQDFTKPRLINKPRGKIYSEQRPENLIACSGSKETKELEIPDSTDDCHAEQSNSPQVVDKLNAQGFRWMLD